MFSTVFNCNRPIRFECLNLMFFYATALTKEEFNEETTYACEEIMLSTLIIYDNYIYTLTL